MVPKPETCRPCPLYGDGWGFVKDLHPPGAEMAILAQNPGDNEERGVEVIQYVGKNKVTQHVDPQPLIGATGFAWKRDFLPKARLDTPVALLNVLKCRVQLKSTDKAGRPKRTNDMPKGKVLKEAVKWCSQYLHLDETVTKVVTHGTYALNVTQGRPMRLKEWRGYETPSPWMGRPVFATLHTAVLFRSPKLRVLALKDWQRVGRWVRGEWPLSLPPRLLCPVEAPHEAGFMAVEDALDKGYPISCDTEFNYDEDHIPGHHALTMIGFSWRVDGTMTGVQWVQDWGPLMDRMKGWCGRGVWIFQNAAADLPVIEYNGGPQVEGWFP